MEDEVRFTLRIMEVLECAPGTTNGDEPICMLTLAHLGEVEQPIMLSLTDARKLLVGLVESLGEHDAMAEWIIENYEKED